MNFLASILSYLLEVYMIVVIINAVLSWFVFGTRNLTVRRIFHATSQIVDPILQPIRRVIGPLTRNFGIDISPIVLLVLLHILNTLLHPTSPTP